MVNSTSSASVRFLILFLLCFTPVFLCAEHTGPMESVSALENDILSFYNSARTGDTPLLQSFMNTAEYLDDTLHDITVLMKTDAGYLATQSFTYDMAVVSIVYILMGEYQKAADVLDDFNDNFWVMKNGLYGLYNSYRTDAYDFFYTTPRGERNLLVIGIDGSRMHTGPALWVGLACQHFFMETGSRRYIDFMLDIFMWCFKMAHFEFADGTTGGVSMGYGWGPPWQEIFATEHNVDYYAFCNNIRRIFQMNDPEIKLAFKKRDITLEMIEKEIAGTLKWLQRVHRPMGIFLRGINDLGEDKIKALDTISWGVAALGPELMFELKIDPVKMIIQGEKLFQVDVEVEGHRFQGFDFTDIEGFQRNRKNTCIWFEGTSQMIVMYHVMADYYRDKGNRTWENNYRKKALFFTEEIRRFVKTFKLEHNALPYTSLNLSSSEIAYTFSDWWPIARGKEGEWVPSVIATSWRYFAELAFNPLDLFSRRKEPRYLDLDLEEYIPEAADPF